MSGQEARFEKLLRLLSRIKTARVHEIWYSISTRLRGLDFAPNSASELGLESGCKGHSGTGGPELMKLLSMLGLPRQWNAIDIGSGKGAACFTLAEYFNEVVGVEISAELVYSALMNRTKLKLDNVAFIVADAREYHGFDRFSLVYMANPYSVDIAKVVMANLRRSLEKAPRHCVIILKHPGSVETAKQYVDMSLFRLNHVYKAPQSTPFNVFEKI